MLIAVACTTQKTTTFQRVDKTISDDSLLTLIEYRTFQYFWDGAEPTSGAARERFHTDNIYPENDKHIITTGGTGFGVMAILVGIERKFITRQQGLESLTKLVNWLETADRFPAYGRTAGWETERLSHLVPTTWCRPRRTSYLLRVVMCASYFKDGNPQESSWH